MSVDEAVGIVARHVIAAAVTSGVSEPWEDYPEIGEYDWERVTGYIEEAAPFPDGDEYEAAYALLTSRANREDS